ncbi:MAG: transposase [Thiolinea sp.]
MCFGVLQREPLKLPVNSPTDSYPISHKGKPVNSLISIASLTSDEACYQQVRALRWPDGAVCPHCSSREHHPPW